MEDALVVLVHKKGTKEDVTNHRPISLLCVVSKVLERCIFKHFKDFLCPLFDNAQHGFLQGRSTVTQLLAFYHEIGQSLDKGLQSDIVYLDLAKAFDSVSHQRLLLKLSRYGVSGNFCSGLRAIQVDAVSSAWSTVSLLVVLQFPQESLTAVSSVLER